MGTGPALPRAIASPFGVLALSSIACVVVTGALLAVRLRQVADDDATSRAGQLAALAGSGVVQPELTAATLRADPAAVAHLDGIVRPLLIADRVVRVKVWDAAGRVVYSDEPRLVGARFPLGPEERRILAAGGRHVERTALRDPENRFERGFGELVATYVRIRGPSGEPMLFESYEKLSTLAASRTEVWSAMLPSLMGGLLLLLVASLGLAVVFGRRVGRQERQRAELTERAVLASDLERRRIAADLHDGVVQDLTAVSYALAGELATSRPQLEPTTAEVLGTTAEMTRQSVQSLRSLLVEAYPPDMGTHGLQAALEDLAESVRTHGMAADLCVEPGLSPPAPASALLLRAAQEGVRNALAHAQARRLAIRAGSQEAGVWLEVDDDGVGFDIARAGPGGHVGLPALRHVLEEAGGRLEVHSAPGHGTLLRAEVPAA